MSHCGVFRKKKISEKVLVKLFLRANNKYPLNAVVLGKLLTFLQLANDEKILRDYSLNDIGLLYSELTNIYKDEVDLNLEHYYFVNNIENKARKAKRKFATFQNRIGKKIAMAQG